MDLEAEPADLGADEIDSPDLVDDDATERDAGAEEPTAEDAVVEDLAAEDVGVEDREVEDAAPADADDPPDYTDPEDGRLDDAGDLLGARPRTPPTYLNSWGGLGTEPGQFIEPSSVELDSNGFVYVAGHEDRFQKFTGDGELIDIYGSPGTGEGEFDHPHGLAVDRRRGDLIYVGDQENHRLQVFRPDGTFVRTWGDELFQHIHDVVIDPASGDVFVGDLESNIVRRFTSAGEEVWQVGGPGTDPGQFDGIWGMSTDSLGNVYAVDTHNRRVQVLDPGGEFLRSWNSYEGEPLVKPTGVFVDADDNVYICDSLAQQVLVFDVNGRSLERWELLDIVGFATEPEDIVLDETGTHIYIAEVRGHLVLHLVR